MNRPVSRGSIISTIIRKDLKEFSRDRFFTIMTVAGLIIYAIMFWLLPSTVSETISIGVHQSGLDEMFEEIAAEENGGLEFTSHKSSGALRAALGLGTEEPEQKLNIGLDFPEDFLEKVALGEKTTVKVYTDSNVPPEIRLALSGWVEEMAYSVSGQALPVNPPDEENIVLGEDRIGNQVSFRERMRPMFAYFILMMEIFALGALVAAEIKARTVTAVTVTPARVSDFLAAKVIVGTLVAFTETTLLMLLINSLGTSPLILLTAILLGAVLITGFGLIAGAQGKDFVATLFYCMLFIIPLAIPAFGVLFPGSASVWVKAMPSYGLINTIVGVTSYNEGWSEVLPELSMLFGWCLTVFAVGWFILKRKVESL